MSSDENVSADMEEEPRENGKALSGRKRGRFDDDEKEISEPCPALPPPVLPPTTRLEQEPSSNDDDVSSAALPKADPFSDDLAMLPSSDKLKFDTAYNRQKKDGLSVLAAHTHLVELRSEFHRAKSSLETAQLAYDEAIAVSKKHSEQGADDLLLAPTEWNSRYLQLKVHFDEKGHSRIKKNISDADVEGMSKEEAVEFRALSRWASRQRKLKRSQDLDHHQVLLLDRLEFSWEPKTGRGSEKWLGNYELLKEFKQMHNHVDVPTQYGDDKLGLWVKNQLNLYRNGKEGKVPAISADRIRMLEELGITWGERRKGIPWEERFQVLLDYKDQYGHSNVPWQWKENIPLAQWVNTQRKKYKDRKDGKKNNLTDAQIDLLDSIGFMWSTGGKGRYMNVGTAPSTADQEPSNGMNKVPSPSSIAAAPFAEQLKPEVVGLAVANNQSSPTATLLSQTSPTATLLSVSSAGGATSNPSTMVTNLQLSFTGTGQNQPNNAVAHNAMAQNTLANLLGGIGNNQNGNVFGGTSLQNATLQMPNTSVSAQAQAMQQLLAQRSQSNPPSNINNNALQMPNTSVSVQAQAQAMQQLIAQQSQSVSPSNNTNQINNGISTQQGNANMLQLLMNNQQQLQQMTTQQTPSISHNNGGMNNVLQMLQVPQNNDLSTVSSTANPYQQLLNQKMNQQLQQQQQQQHQSLGNIVVGSPQVLAQGNGADLSALLQAYSQLHNKK